MNRLPIRMLLAVIVLGGLAVYLYRSGDSRPASGADTPETQEQGILSVDDVATEPNRYGRQIAVRGVVSFVSPKDHVAVLISESEFATCGTACPNIVLPVRWRGELPSVTDRVIVQGEIEKTERGYLFNAAKTTIVERGKTDGR